MAWLSSTHRQSAAISIHNLFRSSSHKNKTTALRSQHHQETMGILAFETARIMSRLVSLYKSLSDEEMKRLKSKVVKSKGVTYLNSHDEDFLLNIACSEKSEDLSRVAGTVSRLSERCSDSDLQKFDVLYRDLKLGMLDMGKLEYGTKSIEKVIQKMERYIQATAKLYIAIESLNEMEISERKLQIWKKNDELAKLQNANFELFEEKLANQRKQVRHYKETSLWSKTFDKCVELMAQAVFVIHARIGVVFASYVIGQPQVPTKNVPSRRSIQRHQQVHPEKDFCLLSEKDKYVKKQQTHNFCLISDKEKFVKRHLKNISKSGPIPQTSRKIGATRFYSRELSSIDLGLHDNHDKNINNKGVIHLASPSTVGGAGLAYRYANLITMAECCLYSLTPISNEGRSELYNMLPDNVKSIVKTKLKSHWDKDEIVSESNDGHLLAEGWREALEDIMGWLSPVAHDTMQWQTERNLEKQRFDSKPGVLLLQTLHFADLEKTEAAIVEVLVGLSCIYRFEKRQLSCDGSVSRGYRGR